MEDILELAIRGIAKLFLFISRAFLFLIWQGLCETIFWYIGWPITKAVTFGKFPESGINQIEKEGLFTQATVIIVGFVAPFISAFYLVQFLGTTTTGT